MITQFETENENASALVRGVEREFEELKLQRDPFRLQSAKASLERAQKEDPHYLKAVYYNALVDDLLGKAQDAIPQFERVLNAEPPFSAEVRYYLGLAHYHRYNVENLQKAIEYFSQVINRGKQDALELFAHASLGQAYAMKMIPAKPDSPDMAAIASYLEISRREHDIAISQSEALGDRQKADEGRWMAHNALGMALMYYSDYVGERAQKVSDLGEAVAEFRQADRYSPNNWANCCDLGSAYMRLGHWNSDSQSFSAARDYLNNVVTRLRPNYGFALYELGRTSRLCGCFEEAIKYFEAALSIPYEFRDVSDRRVNLEIDRVKARQMSFP